MYGGENVTVRHEEFACEMKVTVAVTFLVGIIQVKICKLKKNTIFDKNNMF